MTTVIYRKASIPTTRMATERADLQTIFGYSNISRFTNINTNQLGA